MSFKSALFHIARLLRSNRSPGYIDHFDAYRIAGWAFDPADRNAPALLSLHIDGRPELNIVADVPREDVQAAGLGPLRCGFDTALPRRLRDGNPHVLELRLGSDGPVLNGGHLNIDANAEAALARPSLSDHENAQNPESGLSLREGLVYLDRPRASISGWALGCNSVSVCFDQGIPQTLMLDREVPGFGSGLRPGFQLAIPEAYCDGQPHVAHVSFGGSDELLDGAPVKFTLRQPLPLVELAEQHGTRLILRLRRPDGTRTPRDDVQVHADGALVATDRRGADYSMEMPPGTGWLVVSLADGTLLARFRIKAGQVRPEVPRDLPQAAISDESCAAARTAFKAFCAAPDDRFDPLWYRWAHPAAHGLEDDKALIDHYQSTGAAQGYGPGPWFDETTARRRYPAIAQAIAQESLPCAFALELALGRGVLDTLTGCDGNSPAVTHALSMGHQDRLEPLFDTDRLHAQLPNPKPTRLPPAAGALDPAQSIYAAWLSRLRLTDEQRTEIAQDNFETRRDIASSALTRHPLVTIIMPSWNRAFTIGEAVQSALDQTYSNWELIVCDDASEDRTAEVVRSFDDPRIRYMKFLKSNGAGARNKGLRHARGEYIAYLDSDNIWHPLFLDMMLRQLMGRPGHNIAYCAYLDTEIVGAHVELRDIPRPNFRPVRLSSKNFMDLNTIVHHRRVYDWLGGFDNALPRLQDWDLSLRYTSVFRPIYVNRIGVFYRRNVAWGQVTHLFMGGDAQNTVNEKTRRRLEEAHETLSIDWPERGRITLLCGGPEGHRPGWGDTALARSLARMIEPVADVDLIELGADPDYPAPRDALPASIRVHSVPITLQRAPARLCSALGGLLLGRPILSIGPRGQYLRAMQGIDQNLIWRVSSSGEGCVIQALHTPLERFPIGALPLPLYEGPHDPTDLTLLLLPPPGPAKEREANDTKLSTEAQRRGLTLILPPGGGAGWRQLGKSGHRELDIDPVTALPAELGQVALTVSMVPVSQLDILGLALLNALQGRGVPAAVLPDEGRARATGFARQWIEARAAYEIKVNDPKWIFDKTRKLLGDAAGMERLSERSRIVHSIASHPELARERLYHAIFRLQHDRPRKELIDA